MTNDKAREFFSAFHEGTLEPGLRASLERSLGGDAELRAEYAAFAQTIESLDALRHEAIEIPLYLGDRIARRIDPVLDAKRVPFWQTLFAPRQTAPRFGWALGVAGAFLVAAVGLRGLRVEGVESAGIVSGGGDGVRWSKGGEDVVARFDGASAHRVEVLAEGGEPQAYQLANGQPFELTLSNPNTVARRFKVTVGDDALATVAVPGRKTASRRAGSGTVGELASALADAYKVAVVVKGLAPETPVRWSFDSADARAAAEQSLGSHGSATMMSDRLLQIGG